MDIRQITPRYSVSPQISAADLPAIAAAGYTTLICNRPDAEIPAEFHAERIAEAAQAAGLAFHVLPLTHQTMTPERIANQRGIIDTSPGPVLAYCASGTRCSVVWALAQAGDMATADILTATASAGYQLDQLHPQIEFLAAQRPLRP